MSDTMITMQVTRSYREKVRHPSKTALKDDSSAMPVIHLIRRNKHDPIPEAPPPNPHLAGFRQKIVLETLTHFRDSPLCVSKESCYCSGNGPHAVRSWLMIA